MVDKTLYIDADTILYSSAAKEQILTCKATHLPSGRDKMFASKTAFNNWLKENEKWKNDEFSFESVPEIVGTKINAYSSVKKKIEAILEVVQPKDFIICVQGEGNYRKNYDSKFVAYKAQRITKPIFLPDVKDFVQRKYKDKCLLVEGKEVDDYVCTKAWEHFDQKGSVETSSVVVAFADKDIQQNSPGALFNYFHPEEGVFWNNVEDQYKGFWKSVLTGDAADNIMGVESLGEATRALYGIKTKGCGPVAAGRILTGVSSEKEAAERVLAAYKESWPDDYLERLQDMCFFLWLQREEGQKFDLKNYFDKLGITY